MMEIAITAAVSVDGFISTLDGDSDWVLGEEIFDKLTAEYGCIAMGRTTFEQYEGEDFPLEGVQNIVISAVRQDTQYENVHFVSTVDEAIKTAKKLGYDKLLVIGGSKTNQSFIESGNVNKLYIDVHALSLGEGKKLFGDFTGKLKLELVSSKKYPAGFISLEYKIQS